MDRTRRSAVAISGVGLLCLFTALSGTASAGATLASPASATGSKGIKGDPQPEMTPFKISAAISTGSAAIESNGSLIVTYDIKGGNGKTFVCVLARGGRKCSHTVTLTPLGGVDTFGTPQVFALLDNHVVVLQDTCCDSNTAGGDLLYTSSNGGVTFGAPVRVGSLGVSAAALIGDDIVFGAGDDSGGAKVASIPVTAFGPPSAIAIATAKEAFDIGVGSYRGGALVASDFLGKDYTTYVAYAHSGANFNSSASYHNVGLFSHEQLLAISGDALLTIQTTGKDLVQVRLFNGSKFGAPHAVPGTKGGGPEWFGIDQDPTGRVHVFSETTHSARIYHLIEESTSTGASWSGPVDLGNAISSTSFGAALDARGSGIVLGTDPAIGYPVLATQGISFTLKSSRVKKGRSTTGSGRGFPAASGRLVSLQVERHGLWFTVGTAHENGTGSYRFTIKGNKVGVHAYRAVVSDWAGYLQYGYSVSRSLRVSS
jgi:hypothetical protein